MVIRAKLSIAEPFGALRREAPRRFARKMIREKLCETWLWSAMHSGVRNGDPAWSRVAALRVAMRCSW